MPDELSAAFEQLRASTHRLNTITDSAAQLVKEVEAFLEESGVGIHARTRLYHTGHPEHEPEGCVNLEYRRMPTGKFRIAVVWIQFHNSGEDDELARAWVECSREEKLESF